MNPLFTGSFVALVTPFRNGKVDEAKLRELVEMHAANGTDGLVPCGTTGESPTVSVWQVTPDMWSLYAAAPRLSGGGFAIWPDVTSQYFPSFTAW